MSVTFPPVVATSNMSGLPSVTKAVGLIKGLVRQMPMDTYVGLRRLPRPRLLEQPDPTPNAGRAWWVGEQVEDYLLNGNAVHVITARDSEGVPLAAVWLPAQWVGITTDFVPGRTGLVRYWLHGRELPIEDVVHVRRGADRWNPHRGVGVVEQHLTAFGKLHRQQHYEADAYTNSGIPSVAVIAANSEMSQEEADSAKERWMEKFARREPVILPSGTTVEPLAWSPSDSQMVEAHQMSLQDVANMFGIDGAWLGAPTKGMTYKSVGPLFLQLVREALDPITDDFEQVWGNAWLPMGQKLRFHKQEILGDDPSTEMTWLSTGVEKNIIDLDEARVWLGFDARGTTTTDDGGGSDGDAERARVAAEVAQKVYLATPGGNVLTQDEARDLVRRAGADLSESFDPEELPMPTTDVGDEAGRGINTGESQEISSDVDEVPDPKICEPDPDAPDVPDQSLLNDSADGEPDHAEPDDETPEPDDETEETSDHDD